ncbi:MAG: hypothetical protein ACRD2C_17220 [Acidimicrobiales bacterium]
MAAVSIGVSLAVTGLVRWQVFVGGGSGGSDGDGGGEQVGWEVGACVMPTGGVATTLPTLPPDVEVPPEVEDMREGTQEVEPVACSDDRTFARITHMGETVDTGIGELGLTDGGCPDDTDTAFIAETSNSLGLESQVACTRNLEPPHPGDPGGGGGRLVAWATPPARVWALRSCVRGRGRWRLVAGRIALVRVCPVTAGPERPAPDTHRHAIDVVWSSIGPKAQLVMTLLPAAKFACS